jgi:hypothetical protein
VKIGNVFSQRNDFLKKKKATWKMENGKMGLEENFSADAMKKGRDLPTRPTLHSPFSISTVIPPHIDTSQTL